MLIEGERKHPSFKARALGALLVVAYTGCFASNQDGVPVAPLSPEPTPVTKKLSPGEQYDRFWDRFNKNNIVYVNMLGGVKDDGNPFYEDRETFFRYNPTGTPCRIVFQYKDTDDKFGLAFCGVFIGGTFQLHDGTTTLCAPPTDEKITSFKRLAQDFERGEEAYKRLIKQIMRGATPDCEDYIDLDLKTLPSWSGQSQSRG